MAAPPEGLLAYYGEQAGATVVVTESLDGKDVDVHWLPRQLRNAEHRSLFLSPSGRLLAVAGRVDGRSIVYVLNVDAGTFRQLRMPSPVVDLSSIAWSPNDERIAVSGGRSIPCPKRDPAAAGIYLLSSDGGTPTSRLVFAVDHGMAEFQDLAWSPDGRRLLFAWWITDCDGRWPTVQLTVLDPTQRKPPSFEDSYDVYFSPQWSPDSQRIAALDSEARLYIAPAAGQPERLFGQVPYHDFAWTNRGIYTTWTYTRITANSVSGRLVLVDPRDGSAKIVIDQPEGDVLAAPRSGDFVVMFSAPQRLHIYSSTGKTIIDRALRTPVLESTDETPTLRATITSD